jgi:uncharacterized protein YjiS (DUF1127 family)
MTFATLSRPVDQTLSLQISSDLLHLIQRVEDYRAYRRTVAALQVLSTSELADLGLTPHNIKDAARTAVYGARD